MGYRKIERESLMLYCSAWE